MNPYWMDKNYSFFQHKQCEYFPCHKTDSPASFSCMFCYCPLYALGENCGGDFFYSKKGFKCCTNCLFPHRRENYGKMLEGVSKACKLVKKAPEE